MSRPTHFTPQEQIYNQEHDYGEIDPDQIQIEEIDINPEIDIESDNSNLRLPIRDRGWSFSESFHSGPVRRGPRTVVLWSWAAAMIDLGIVIGFSLFITGLGLSFLKGGALSGFGVESRGEIYGVMLGGFSFVYMLMLRSFLGFSFGELACGLRLGTLLQRKMPTYPLKVLLRSAVIFATGIVVLPLLSLLLKEDVAGKITGVPIVSLK